MWIVYVHTDKSSVQVYMDVSCNGPYFWLAFLSFFVQRSALTCVNLDYATDKSNNDVILAYLFNVGPMKQTQDADWLYVCRCGGE